MAACGDFSKIFFDFSQISRISQIFRGGGGKFSRISQIFLDFSQISQISQIFRGGVG